MTEPARPAGDDPRERSGDGESCATDGLDVHEIHELIVEGREQGYLAVEHVTDVLNELDLSTDQNRRGPADPA